MVVRQSIEKALLPEIDLTTLRLFVLACDLGSFAQVSKYLEATPLACGSPAISKRLSQLQHDMGVTLLSRHRYGVAPTAAGQTLLERSRAMLQEATNIHRDMAAYVAGARGTVRVLASASAMAESLTDDIATFLQQPQASQIQIDLEERVSSEIVRGLQDGVASLGVFWNGTDIGNLRSKNYSSDELAVVVRRNHSLAKFSKLKLDQALDYDQVVMPANSAVQVMLRREAAKLGKPLLARVTVSNYESALRVVRAGLGISILPLQMASQYKERYGLAIVRLDEPWAVRQFVVCYLHEASLAPAARLLLNHLTQSTA